MAVHEPAPMNSSYRVNQLRSDVEQTVPAQGSAGNDFVEGTPLEELADDEWLAILLAGLVHCADVRVRDERCDPCLVTKSVNRAGAGHFLGP